MVRKILNPRNGDRGSTPREIRYLLLVKKGERKPTSAIKTYVKHDRTWTGVEWSKHSVLFENQDLGVGGRRRRAAVGGSRLGVVVHGGAFERVRNLGMRARTRTHTMRQSQRPQSATPERQAGGGRGGGGNDLGLRGGRQARPRRVAHLICGPVPLYRPRCRHSVTVSASPRLTPRHPHGVTSAAGTVQYDYRSLSGNLEKACSYIFSLFYGVESVCLLLFLQMQFPSWGTEVGSPFCLVQFTIDIFLFVLEHAFALACACYLFFMFKEM
jgi:hypothetical protein